MKRQKSMDRFNVLGMRCVCALVDSNFVIRDASKVLGINETFMSDKLMGLREYSGTVLFLYRQRKTCSRPSVIGLTVSGHSFYLACKQMLDLVDNSSMPLSYQEVTHKQVV